MLQPVFFPEAFISSLTEDLRPLVFLLTSVSPWQWLQIPGRGEENDIEKNRA